MNFEYKVEGGCWNRKIHLHNGYPVVELYEGGKRVFRKRVCNLLWEQINGAVPAGKELHHSCVNRLCINPEHLECLTSQEHGKRHAHQQVSCKLTESIVREMKLRKLGGETCIALGREFGIRADHVREIMQGQFWKDVRIEGEERLSRPRYKITSEDVKEIKRRRLAGETNRQIAKDYGLSRDYVGEIFNGKTWKGVSA